MENYNIEEEKFRAFFSAFTTVTLLVFIGYLLSFIPNELNIEFIKNNYNLSIEAFVAEKSEKFQFVICTILFPIVYILMYILFKNKYKPEYKEIIKYLLFIEIFLPISIFIITFISVPYYFNILMISQTDILGLTIIFALSCIVPNIVIMFSIFKSKVINIIIFMIGFSMIVILSYTFITETYYFNGYTAHHFDAYFYPVYKVYCGYTPLVDFDNLYGLYPYILEPILKLGGGINMLNFSILMSIIVFITYISIFITLYLCCSNKLVSLLGVMAIIVVVGWKFQLYYLQYNPHRMLFPSLIILLCLGISISEKQRNKYILRVLGYIVAGISFIWNIDTGIVVIIAYCLFLIYLELLDHNLTDKKLYISIFKILVLNILLIFTVLLFIFLITYLRTNKIVNFKNILFGQISFYGTGFYMLKMPLIHPWWLIIMIYGIGLIKSLKCMKFMGSYDITYSKVISNMYFVISIVGLGTFLYYQGRSHNDVMQSVTWPAFILLSLFIQEYIIKIKAISKLNKIKFLFACIILSALIYPFVISANRVLKTPFFESTHKNLESTPFYDIDKILYLKGDDKYIDLIMRHSETIYSIIEQKTIPNISALVDWFRKEDYRKVIEYIKSTNNKIIFSKEAILLLNTYCNEEINQVLSDRFEKLYEDSDYYVVVKK